MANDIVQDGFPDVFEEKLARLLIKHIEGCSKLNSAERLSGGAAQETYRISVTVDGREKLLALRRASGGGYSVRSATHPGLEVEALLMKCALAAGIPEPEIYYVLQREDDLGDGFVMQWLDGEALGARIVRSASFSEIRPKLAFECGRPLARIHNIDLVKSGLNRKLGTVSPDEFIDQMWARYKLLQTPRPMIDYTARWLKANLPENSETTLVHNEFRNGNIMISPSRIVAVLDWEEAHIGDPMRDLGWLCTNSWRYGSDKPVGGFGEYEALFQGYEKESGKTVDKDHVRFWEVFGSFWWAVVSLGFVDQYRTGTDKSVERPAVGRRSSEAQMDCVNLIIPGFVEPFPASSRLSPLDMPGADELLASVRDFLRLDVMAETRGRINFMARVASNSIDIVIRELALGERKREGERERLARLYGVKSNDQLRWRLVNDLRDGALPLDDEALICHLRATVVEQLAIDQPGYSGYRTSTTLSITADQ